MKESNLSVLLGAAFLMATSAIGPGFLTQTTVFTSQLKGSFGFVILVTIIIHAITQLNVWRIIAVSKKPGQDIANAVLPGLDYFVSALVVAGGLAFNIGNIGGAGLGMNVLFGISPVAGALISTVIAVFIFLNKEAGAPYGPLCPDCRRLDGAPYDLCGVYEPPAHWACPFQYLHAGKN